MSAPTPYLPQEIFTSSEGSAPSVPRVFGAPGRYVQGDGIIANLGRYLGSGQRVGVLISSGGQRRFGSGIAASLDRAGIDSIVTTFGGECSVEEVDRCVDALRAGTPPIDALVAVGGGKCIDAGRCVAYRLGVPAAIVPTLASNDAPCSALSVMYEPSGAFTGVEFFPTSPALVVVDTRIVAEAPARYLAAGMGDALATWYEARTCFDNPNGRSAFGARPTCASNALAERCATILYADGEAAMAAVRRTAVDDSLERVVEANTLLSGVGFESGGVAAAHAVAQALTVLPEVHRNHLHGEMVAIGLLTQLALEDKGDEAQQVGAFFARVGLPVHLGQVSMAADDEASVNRVVDVALTVPIIANEPFAVTPHTLRTAMLEADALGLEVAHSSGAEVYASLHA